MPVTRSSGSTRRTPSSSSHNLQIIGAPSGSTRPVTPAAYIQLQPAPSPFTLHAQPVINRTKQKQRAIPPPTNSEVIEISSDEEDLPQPPRRAVAPASSKSTDTRKEVRKLKDSNAALTLKLKSLQSELEAQKEKTRVLENTQKRNGGKDEIILDPSEVEDIVACGICTHPMLVPFILPGCGHTFCQKCLTGWFDTTLRNFIVAHPNYIPNNPMPGMQHMAFLMNNPAARNHPAFINLFPPQPEYHCPECRTPVKARPVENFAMKAFARMCHTATEGRPPTTPARPRGSPWDGFFPQ